MSPRTKLITLALVIACASPDKAQRDASVDASASAAPPAVAAPPASEVREPASNTWTITTRGFGPVVTGMSLAALGEVLSEPLHASYAAGSRCAYVRPRSLPRSVLVMLQNDTVVRVDVRASGVHTAEGIGVGDTEARVASVYAGRVRTTPHKYITPGGHYLTVSASADSSHLIVFETDGRTVQAYRAGSRPAVELVEGCG